MEKKNIYIYIGHMMVIFDGMFEIFDGRYITDYTEIATMTWLII